MIPSRRVVPALLGLVLVFLAVPPTLHAQGLSGLWEMSTTAFLPQARPAPALQVQASQPCVYVGICQMTQNGSVLTGTVDLGLSEGPEGCPVTMTAVLEGVVDGDDVTGTLEGPQGTAEFVGSRTNSFSGTFTTPQGRSAGSTGSWLAVRPAAIPALSGVGLTLLVFALLAGGWWALRREARPA